MLIHRCIEKHLRRTRRLHRQWSQLRLSLSRVVLEFSCRQSSFFRNGIQWFLSRSVRRRSQSSILLHSRRWWATESVVSAAAPTSTSNSLDRSIEFSIKLVTRFSLICSINIVLRRCWAKKSFRWELRKTNLSLPQMWLLKKSIARTRLINSVSRGCEEKSVSRRLKIGSTRDWRTSFDEKTTTFYDWCLLKE